MRTSSPARSLTLTCLLLPLAIPGRASADPAVRTLSLQEVLASAQRDSPVIRAAEHAVGAARERKGAAFAAYLPNVMADASIARQSGELVTRPGLTPGSAVAQVDPTSGARDDFSLGLSVRQLLYDFGRATGANDAAQAGIAAVEQDLASTRLQAGHQALTRYLGVLATQELVGVAVRAEERARRYADRAVGLFQAGARPRLDVARAEAEAQAAGAARAAALRSLVVARAALLSAMGSREVFEFEVLPAPRPASDATSPRLDEASAEAMRSRPELASLHARLAAQAASLHALRGGYFPSLSLTGAVAEIAPDPAAPLWGWAVAIRLDVPVFQGLATRHQVGEAGEVLAGVQAALLGQEITVRTEVAQAIAQLEYARAAIGPLQAAQAAAREAVTLVEGRYEAGTANQIELLDARAALANAEAAAVMGEYDLAQALASLDRARGRPAAAWRVAAARPLGAQP